MDTTERQDLSVFWCTQCNKPFHKPNTPRAKAPSQGTHTGRSKTATPQIVEHIPSTRSFAGGAAGDTVVQGVLALSDQELSSFGGYLDWDDTGVGLADIFDTQSFSSPISLGSSTSTRPATTSTTQTQISQAQGGLSWASPSIPPTPSIAVRSLIHRPTTQYGTQRTINLILHNLKSYPLMIQRHNDLPPFVHKSVISSSVEDVEMEPLTNCLSLVHMINGGVQTGRKLFWKNVRMECERLSAEHLNLSKWGLLSAIQALAIYVLVRLGEGETESNNVDFLLVKAVSLIIQQLSRVDVTCQTQCMACNNGLETTWKEWIFRESRRRLGVIYRVVNMVFYFDPAAMCQLPDDLVLAPLPARKQLWEAGDESAWMTESRSGPPSTGDSFGLAADGEVVRLYEGRLSCDDAWVSRSQASDASTAPSRGAAGWEEWCSGVDGFGGLIMLAASLVG